jgi:CheY-like chemotaxis protein
VSADPDQVEQILSSLVVNARDAMPEGGRITVALREVAIGADDTSSRAPARPGNYVVLAVTDTGPGMDAEARGRIFEPYFTTRELGRGTGLGLSTVEGIAEQSGGFVGVRSAPGAGTTLEVYLPLVGEAVQPNPAAAPAAGPGAAGTILLVEDEPALRDLVRQVLSDDGYSVLVAGDGAEALRIAASHAGPIDLLVTDIEMPGMTGPRVAEAVVRARPAIRVLYVSGYSDEAVQCDRLVGPARAFLSKPFGLDQLTRAIRELVEGAG